MEINAKCMLKELDESFTITYKKKSEIYVNVNFSQPS